MVNQSRLSKKVIPTVYDLHLSPDLEKSTFTGRVDISVEFKEQTNEVAFHSQVNITSYILHVSSAEHKPIDIKKDDNGVVTLTFDRAFEAGTQACLKLLFNGDLNDKLVGFYRSKYKVNGEERYMAVTQMEPVDARRAFPCWDDPSFKTVFKISVEAPEGRVAISNMPVTSTAPNNGKTISYLLK